LSVAILHDTSRPSLADSPRSIASDIQYPHCR